MRGRGIVFRHLVSAVPVNHLRVLQAQPAFLLRRTCAAPQPKVSREDLNHVLPEKGPDPWNYADLPLRTSSYACTGAGERTARTGRFV